MPRGNNALMMETLKFIVILILYCVCTGACYPSRPLNERAPELTWQAWLLVDDQNQSKQQTNSDGMLRRRITPKSVFIAPTFSPESLPACAEGYNSDPMGRCIKIIRLDQDAHYEFLLEKLKEKFTPFDYEEEEEEELTTPGPSRVSIPLGLGGDYAIPDDSEEDSDVAIIVSPTKPNYDFTINLDKRDSDDENRQESMLKKLAEVTTKQRDETTTVTEQPSTSQDEATSTIMEGKDTTIIDSDILTDAVTETEDVKRSTTTVVLDTETVPTQDLTTITTEAATVPDFILTTQSPKPEIESIPEAELRPTEPLKAELAITTVSPKPEVNYVRFPDEPKVQALTGSYVKFPDSDVSYQSPAPSSGHITHIRDTEQSDHSVIFRDQPSEATNGVQTQIPPSAVTFNRRNRDKHNGMFLLPPRWNPSSFQKPLVLRFSRKHAYGDPNRFKTPDYYRSIPHDDFHYLFKFKHKQPVNRR